jgi:hypothetical protein
LLTTAPVLIIARVGKYVLCSDAGDTGCGMLLLLPCTRTGQPGGVVAYFAKSYSSAALRYLVTEEELLALIISVRKFKQLRVGQEEVTCLVDEAALVPMFNDPKYVWDSHRVQRWIWLLSDVKVRVFYLEGPLNVVPDWISRF